MMARRFIRETLVLRACHAMGAGMVEPRQIPRLTALLLPLLMAGCASSSDRYPSLAVREVERVSGTFTPVDSGPQVLSPAPAPEDQAARLQSLISQAESVHREFLAATPRARLLVGQVDNTSPDSNAWAEAQIALGDLESKRSQAALALGDLDLLYAAASTGFVDRTDIDEARERVIGWIAEEDAVLAGLRAEADR